MLKLQGGWYSLPFHIIVSSSAVKILTYNVPVQHAPWPQQLK
jgi:hypothetical protein